jgi:hypothetical protein
MIYVKADNRVVPARERRKCSPLSNFSHITFPDIPRKPHCSTVQSLRNTDLKSNTRCLLNTYCSFLCYCLWAFIFILSSKLKPRFLTLTLILLMWRIGRAPNSILIYIQQDATLHSLFLSGNCSTRFGWYFHFHNILLSIDSDIPVYKDSPL